MCVFCMVLSIDNHDFTLIAFYNRDGVFAAQYEVSLKSDTG